MMLIGSTICFSAFASPDQTAFQQCNSILADDVFQTYERTLNFKSRVALKKWLCSTDFAAGSQGYDSALRMTSAFSTDGQYDDLQRWKDGHCEESDKTFDGSKSSHLLIQHAKSYITEEWAQCVERKVDDHLFCYGVETDDSVLMTLRLSGYRDFEVSKIQTPNLMALTEKPREISPGKFYISYEKRNPARDASFHLQGLRLASSWWGKDYSASCSYQLPREPKPSNYMDCEQFRIQALNADKITFRQYRYMKDSNMVPLFDVYDGSFKGQYSCDIYEG